jgi:chromosome segregation ATPase
MATTTDNVSCHICGQDVETFKCTKCDKVFCFSHLQAHREETVLRMQDVQNNLNLTRERVNHLEEKLEDHPCMQTIDHWERDSIVKIQQAAENARRTVKKRLTEHLRSMKVELEDLFTNVRQHTEKNKFDETHVNQWNSQLNQLKETIDQPSNITIIESSKPLINLLYVNILMHISRK